jgi:hypothetical protein
MLIDGKIKLWSYNEMQIVKKQFMITGSSVFFFFYNKYEVVLCKTFLFIIRALVDKTLFKITEEEYLEL